MRENRPRLKIEIHGISPLPFLLLLLLPPTPLPFHSVPPLLTFSSPSPPSGINDRFFPPLFLSLPRRGKSFLPLLPGLFDGPILGMCGLSPLPPQSLLFFSVCTFCLGGKVQLRQYLLNGSGEEKKRGRGALLHKELAPRRGPKWQNRKLGKKKFSSFEKKTPLLHACFAIPVRNGYFACYKPTPLRFFVLLGRGPPMGLPRILPPPGPPFSVGRRSETQFIFLPPTSCYHGLRPSSSSFPLVLLYPGKE